jgi:Domain of unknown function (DUF3387)
MRVLVRRILRKHGYPPDKQEKAIQTVLERAELLSEACLRSLAGRYLIPCPPALRAKRRSRRGGRRWRG